MKVVTKIRSKLSQDTFQNDMKSSDFNGQVDLKLLSQDGNVIDSQGEELQMKEQQELLGPQFVSPNQDASQLSDQVPTAHQFSA